MFLSDKPKSSGLRKSTSLLVPILPYAIVLLFLRALLSYYDNAPSPNQEAYALIAYLLVSLVTFIGIHLGKTTHRNWDNRKRDDFYSSLLTCAKCSLLLLATLAFLAHGDRGVMTAAVSILLPELLLLTAPLTLIYIPFLERAFRRSMQHGLRRLQRTLPFVFCATLTFSLLAFALAKELVSYFYGEAHLRAAALLSAMAPVLFFTTMNRLFGHHVRMHLGKDKAHMHTLLLDLVITATLIALCMLLFPPAIAMVAFSLAEALIFAKYLVFIRRSASDCIDLAQFNPKHVVNNVLYIISERAERNRSSVLNRITPLRKLMIDGIWEIKTTEKVLYLTFDDGPNPDITPFVLDELQKAGAHATFFCVGENVQAHPGLYQRIIREGHAVGNHTFSHIDGWKTTRKKYLADVDAAARYIQSDLFRPPYGHINRLRSNQLRSPARNLRTVLWTVVSADYDNSITGEQCVSNVLGSARSGSIILFHDSALADKNLRYALPRVLQHYAAEGYRFDAIGAAQIRNSATARS